MLTSPLMKVEPNNIWTFIIIIIIISGWKQFTASIIYLLLIKLRQESEALGGHGNGSPSCPHGPRGPRGPRGPHGPDRSVLVRSSDDEVGPAACAGK